MPEYLSTDPNAGTPVPAGGYLSTDPTVSATAPKAEIGKPNQLPADTPPLGIKGALLSLGAPGGLSRMTSAAEKSLEGGAYRAGGATTDLASGFLPPKAAAALGTGVNVGIQSLPMLAGGGLGSKAAPAIERGATEIMTAALKPDKFARESGKGAQAVKTLLEKGFNVTEGGVEKMTAEIDKLDDALTQALQQSKGKVDVSKAIAPVKDAIQKFRYGLDQATDKQAIRAEVLKFLDHPEVQRAMEIPVQTAQEIKRAIYREAGDKAYGFGIKPEAQQAGKKAIASGLKSEIERVAPETGAINKEMGPLINARDLTQQRVMSSLNKDPLGLGSLITDPRKLAIWLAQRSELMKSLAARGLYANRTSIPAGAGALAGEGVNLGAKLGRPDQR